MLALITEARNQGRSITVPVPVVAAWWRGQQGPVARLLDAFGVEPIGHDLARLAGAALMHVGAGPTATDAIVMASAAQRGDLVLTSNIEQLSKLQRAFAMVSLLRV